LHSPCRRGGLSLPGIPVMIPFGDQIWIEYAPARILGMRLTTTMTVVRLPDGNVLVHSPLEATAERRAAIEALGPLTHLYAPNTYHDRHLAAWAEAYPHARVHAPEALKRERPELRVDRFHDREREAAFAGVFAEVPIDGFRLRETVLLHLPSRTAIVADLVQNVGRPRGMWTGCYTRVMGFHDRVALSRAIRWMGFNDRAAARRSLDDLLQRPFDRIIVGHGTPVESGARDALSAAMTWLPATRS
jgi:hypothetical protein